jgi:hypothetical protein
MCAHLPFGIKALPFARLVNAIDMQRSDSLCDEQIDLTLQVSSASFT